MRAQAKLLWGALTRVCAKEALPKIQELPIQAVSALIRTLLRELADEDRPDLALTESAVEGLIYRVAFLQIQDHLLQTQSTAGQRERVA